MKLQVNKEDLTDKFIKSATQIKELNEKMLKLTATTEQIAKILVKQKTKIAEIENNMQNFRVKNLDNLDNLVEAVKDEIKIKQKKMIVKLKLLILIF